MRERNPCEVQRPEINGTVAQRLFEESLEAGHVAKYCAPVEEVKEIEREIARENQEEE